MLKSLPATTIALICIFAWSFIPIISKIGQLHIDNLQFLFWSNFLSCIAVGFTIKPSKEKIRHSIKYTNYKQTFVLGFLGCFFYYLCLYYGYAKGEATEVLIVQYLWPALVPIFAVFILKEKLNIYKIISIVFGFIAAVLVFTKGNILSLGNSNILILFIVFIGAISFSLFSILSKLEKRINVSFSVFMYFLWASVFSFSALLIWSKFVIPDIESMFIIVVNGVFINGLTYILWVHALSKEAASKIAPLVYISPVLSVIWIAIIFGDNITSTNIVAVFLVIVSGLLVTTESKFIPKHITRCFTRTK